MANINAGPFTTRPEIDGTFGVVASTHWIGTAVGMGVLERGGNAFDAGVATAFTLQVVEPHLCGPGGDVPVMICEAGSTAPKVICGQGPAPAGATIAHYRGHLGLDIVPGTGLLPACIPGTFETFMMVLRDYGTLRLRDVLEPAIAYAENGHPLVERACATIATVADLFREHWPTSAAMYLPGGQVPAPGTLFTNRRHAETYRRILKEAETGGGGREAEIERARRAWSQGFVAEAIDRFCRNNEIMDVSGRRHRGVLTAQDMATWLPTVEEPVHLDYGSYRVLKPHAWTQGPVLLQMLALLKGFDLDRLAPTDPDFIHIWVECAKLAYADREAFYGDPKFVDVPMADPAVGGLQRRAAQAGRRHGLAGAAPRPHRGLRRQASSSRVPGRWAPAPASPPSPASPPATAPTRSRATAQVRGDTVHIDVIDKAGNMFTATPSGGWLQSSPVIPELGWPLGTRGQMFWLEEGQPALAGAGQAPALHALGRHGAARRQALHELGHARRRPAGPVELPAVPAPRPARRLRTQDEPAGGHRRAGVAHRALSRCRSGRVRPGPACWWRKDRLPAATIEELQRRGHKVEVGPDWSEGRLTAAAQDGPRRKAAANPRGMQGYAAGR